MHKSTDHILISLGTSIVVLIVSLAWFEIYVLLANEIKTFERPVYNRLVAAILISVFAVFYLFYFKSTGSFFKREHGDPTADIAVTPEGAAGGVVGVQMAGA